MFVISVCVCVSNVQLSVILAGSDWMQQFQFPSVEIYTHELFCTQHTDLSNIMSTVDIEELKKLRFFDDLVDGTANDAEDNARPKSVISNNSSVASFR